MHNTFLQRPSRIRPLLLVILALVIVLAAITVAVVVVGRSGSTDPVLQPGSAAPASQRTLSVPVGPMTLIGGAHTDHGVAVGSPPSPEGGVSAAVEYFTQLGSTLDP